MALSQSRCEVLSVSLSENPGIFLLIFSDVNNLSCSLKRIIKKLLSCLQKKSVCSCPVLEEVSRYVKMFIIGISDQVKDTITLIS